MPSWMYRSAAGATMLSNPSTSNTPSSTPDRLASPPRMRQQRTVMDRWNEYVSGSAVLPRRRAYRAPARPASPPPRANAMSFNLAVFSPMQPAANSSSRRATHARPIRLRSRWRSSTNTKNSTPRVR